MARYAMIHDVSKCVGCYTCFLACKDEYTGNDHLPYSLSAAEGAVWCRVNEMEYGTGSKVKTDFFPVMCQQCADPACAKSVPAGVICKRPDGIVLIDPVKAGSADIIKNEVLDACPYHCISWNDSIGIPQKCTFCAHMLDAGETTTRCAEACPTGALVFGDLDDPNSAVSKAYAEYGETFETFRPEFGMKTSVKYRSLPKPFIAGEVCFGDTGACAKEVKVILRDETGDILAQTLTDFLGDFEFIGLGQNLTYKIEIIAEGYTKSECLVRTNSSKNIGLIELEPN